MNKIDLLFESRKQWTDFQINLLISLIYKVGKKDPLLKIYKIKAKDILFHKQSLEELKAETKVFISQTYEIKTINKLTQLSIFSSISFIIGEGIIEITLHPLFKTYFLSLKENYTLITLKYLLNFKSIFSKKIYLFLKKTNEGVSISIEELKAKLKLEEAYQDYNTFKRRVVLQSQKELHNTDMAFLFEEVKASRKVEFIKFKQILIQNIELSNNQKELQKKLIEETKISKFQAKKIVIKFMSQEIYSTLYIINDAKYSGRIKTSLAGYTISIFNKMLIQKH